MRKTEVIDAEIKENAEILKKHLDYLEKDETEVMYIIARVSNKLNQLFREKEGFSTFDGRKVGGNENG